MKRLFRVLIGIIVSVWLVPVASVSAAAPTEVWARSWGDASAGLYSPRGAGSVLLAPDGDIVTIGTVSRQTGVWRHAPDGSARWDTAEPWMNGATGAIDSAGNILAVGNSWNYFRSGIIVRKLSPSGEELWRAGRAAGDFSYTAAAAVTDAAGNLYVAGNQVPGEENNTGGRDFMVMKFDPAGNVLWSRHHDGGHGDDAASSMVLMSDGGVAAAGYTATAEGNQDFLAIRYAPDGTPLWVRTWGYTTGTGDAATALLVDGSDNLTLGGNTRIHSELQYVSAVRFSAVGTLLWQATFLYTPDGWYQPSFPLHYNELQGMALNSAGDLALSMATHNYTFGRAIYEFGTIALLAPGGAVRKQTQINSYNWGNISSPTQQRIIGPVVSHPDGAFLVGFSTSGLARVNANGSVDWTVSSPDPSGDKGVYNRSIKIDGSGNMYQLLSTYSSFYGTGGVTVRKWQENSGPLAPVVATTGASSVSAFTAEVTGTVDIGPTSGTWWFEYGSTTGYGLSTPASTLKPGGGSVPVSATLSQLTPGSTWHFRMVARNADGPVRGADATFTTSPPPFQVWAEQKFGASNAPGSALLDDPDNDGLTNLTEFAFSGEPLAAGLPTGLPVAEWYSDSVSGAKRLTISYTVNPAATDLQYFPEAGSGLATFSADNITVETLPGNRRRAIAPEDARFMRVRVQYGP